MIADRLLTPLLTELYANEPGITTDEAARRLHARLQDAPPDELRAAVWELVHEGLKVKCRHFYGRLRDRALKRIRKATLRRDADGAILGLYLQTKLPLPDADYAPTLEESTVLHLQRSASYLRQMERATGDQAARIEALADALGGLVTLVREPGLTVGEATMRGLLDWESIAAA